MTDKSNRGDVAITEHEGVYLVTPLTGSAYIVDIKKMAATRSPHSCGEDVDKNLRKGGGVRRDRWRNVRSGCAVGDASQVRLGTKARPHDGPRQRLGSARWLPEKNEDSGKDWSI